MTANCAIAVDNDPKSRPPLAETWPKPGVRVLYGNHIAKAQAFQTKLAAGRWVEQLNVVVSSPYRVFPQTRTHHAGRD